MYKIDCRQRNRPYPLGVTTTEFGYTYFSVVMKNGNDCGIVLYDRKTGKETRIPFLEQNKYGSIFSIALKDLDIGRFAYNFYDGEQVFTDPYAKMLHGHEKWGKCPTLLKGGFVQPDYDWEGDKPLKIPYEDSILYCLNVRAFTRHKSSGVAHKGTFSGLAEKIPYLRELGITEVELMPAYEFDEVAAGRNSWQPEAFRPPLTMEEAKKRLAEYVTAGTELSGKAGQAEENGTAEAAGNAGNTEENGTAEERTKAVNVTGTVNKDGTEAADGTGRPENKTAADTQKPVFAKKTEPERYNCWGYQEGFYFAPKSAFASDKNAVKEFKDMVKAFHQNGIEVIMQFYFPNSVKMGMIQDAIEYWMLEYHIDGFHLKGEQIPLQALATEPLLTDTKLFYYNFPYERIYGNGEMPVFRNLGNYNDEYMYTVRRFLKGDEGMVGNFLELQRRNPPYCGTVNYITNYYGFTLADMVSYERKHNEENGEKNMDGSDYNLTWNCGAEGTSRKKTVLELRKRQMKNALSMLFLGQGTPLIYSGDEFGNTRYGNNNPYCQDNETGWVKWNMGAAGREVFHFAKGLIALRKKHPVLHNGNELKILDYTACGYPDLSYHGEEAWRADFGSHSRFAGVMYCGCYAKKGRDEDDDFFYVAYNMHWIPHSFALPTLPKGMKWQLAADTGRTAGIMDTAEEAGNAQTVGQQAQVAARSIQVYISRQEKGARKEAWKKYTRSAF